MKVNKRIGKLKQWTGEKLGGQQKTELSEDFQSLEQDVELRKAGVEKLYSVSKEFSKHLTKKIEAEGTDTGKVIPIDALGLVCTNHGEEFGHDSAFGQALTAFGKAQQQIATSTANFSDFLNSGWLSSLEKSLAQMQEYTNQRKKLDSRRLTYDAMLAKVQKSKKEKRDLEDDLRVAKNRYEETSEEVQERAIAVQDSEADQLLALTRLLEIESSWIDEQKRIMDDLKRNWVDSASLRGSGGRKKVTAHTFGAEPAAPAPKPAIKGKVPLSHRSSRTHYSEDDDDYLTNDNNYHHHHHHQFGGAEPHEDEDDDEPDYLPNPRRRPKPAGAPPPKPRAPVTREPSMRERSSNSNFGENRFGGVRIPGMPPGGGGTISDDSVSPTRENPNLRKSNASNRQQQVPKPSSPGLRRSMTVPNSTKPVKILKAKWAYNATESDELELSIGDRVRVTTEVNGEWFIGRNESTGRTGMFPAAYCVAVADEASNENSGRPSAGGDDMFADPDQEEEREEEEEEDAGVDGDETEEDQSEGAALRPSRSMPQANSSPQQQQQQQLRPGSNSYSKVNSGTGKRAPPPPPTRRSATTGGGPSKSTNPSKTVSPNQSFQQQEDNQPEAFGSVSELKKRLGMFK